MRLEAEWLAARQHHLLRVGLLAVGGDADHVRSGRHLDRLPNGGHGDDPSVDQDVRGLLERHRDERGLLLERQVDRLVDRASVPVPARKLTATELERRERPEALPALEELASRFVGGGVLVAFDGALGQREVVEDDGVGLGTGRTGREDGKDEETDLLRDVVESERVFARHLGTVGGGGGPDE